ncbi:hypothetical protein Tco_0738346 [Tanacetum coccineum]
MDPVTLCTTFPSYSRFDTSAGNPVKEILLKLNLPDHMSFLTDSKVTPTKHGRITKPYSSPRFIANCFNVGYLKIEVKRQSVKVKESQERRIIIKAFKSKTQEKHPLNEGWIISTTPARENDEFIKSSVDDLVPIPRESEVTLVSTDLECIMPIDSPPLPCIDFLGDRKVDIDLPFGENLDTLSIGDREIDFNPSDLETIGPVLDPRMFDVPLGNDDSISRYFSYSLITDNKIFDDDFEDLCSLDPLKSIPLIDESILLVTPLPDPKQLCLREVERVHPFFSLTQSGDMTWVTERPSYRFPHMPLPRQVAYSPKIPSDESTIHIEVLSVLWGNMLPIPDGSLPLSSCHVSSGWPIKSHHLATALTLLTPAMRYEVSEMAANHWLQWRLAIAVMTRVHGGNYLERSDEGDMEISSLTEEPLNTLLIGDEVISTTLVRENDEFIKSSVDDLVLIPRESEETLKSRYRLTFWRTFRHPLNGDREIDFNPSDLETIDLVSDPRMYDVPLGNDDSISRYFDVTISYPLCDFDDSYSLIIDNKIFDDDFEDLCSLDPLKTIPLIDESILLVTPLPDPKQLCLREVERVDPFFSLTQSGDMTWVMERPSYRFPHMPLPRQVAYLPKVVMYRYFHPNLILSDGCVLEHRSKFPYDREDLRACF